MNAFAGKRVALVSDSDLGVAVAVALSRAGACIVTPYAEAVWNAGGVLGAGTEADFTVEIEKDGSVVVRPKA
jgi:hypothetical protein